MGRVASRVCSPDHATARCGARRVRAGEFAAVIASFAVVAIALALLLALTSLIRTLAQLRTTLEDVRQQALPLVTDLRSTVGQANAELDRVDGLLVSAESISQTVDSASRLAYLFFANPVV